MSSTAQNVCLLCQHASPRLGQSAIPLRIWQSVRGVAQVTHRRPPSRMVLSPKVARPKERPAPNGNSSRGRSSDPFSGLNQRDAGLHRQPRSRSLAEQRRSSGGKASTKGDKTDQGTFKALKMQRALAAVSYGHRNTVKDRISNLETFD